MYPRSKEHRKKQIVQAAPLGAVAHQKISKRDAGPHVAGYSNAMLWEWAALPSDFLAGWANCGSPCMGLFLTSIFNINYFIKSVENKKY
jgi:hypothetical protein